MPGTGRPGVWSGSSATFAAWWMAMSVASPSRVEGAFSCGAIMVDCACRWSSSGAWKQLMGLRKAPAEADVSARECEKWCCEKVSGWTDYGHKGPEQRCDIWQYMPPDPTGKENLGCWAGARAYVTGDRLVLSLHLLADGLFG
jgi:hypothetical protein